MLMALLDQSLPVTVTSSYHIVNQSMIAFTLGQTALERHKALLIPLAPISQRSATCRAPNRAIFPVAVTEGLGDSFGLILAMQFIAIVKIRSFENDVRQQIVVCCYLRNSEY